MGRAEPLRGSSHRQREGREGRYFKGGELLPEHKTWFFYLARICNHCSYPACLAACPRNAIYKRPEDGIVLVDQERCRGYRKCMEACPYKKTYYRGTTRTTEKCIGCFPRVEGKDQAGSGSADADPLHGLVHRPHPLAGPGRVEQGRHWKEMRNNPLYYLIHVAKVALPLYPQFGTEPNGYYIPPRWVSRPICTRCSVPAWMPPSRSTSAPDRELLAVLQLFGKDQRICHRYEIKEGPKVFETEVRGKKFVLYNDTIIGYAKDGTKIIETTVEEPLHIRPGQTCQLHLNPPARRMGRPHHRHRPLVHPSLPCESLRRPHAGNVALAGKSGNHHFSSRRQRLRWPVGADQRRSFD
jgi:nitrate reductase beta subunit